MAEDARLRLDLHRLFSSRKLNRILDVGCGSGLAYELLGKINAEYVGLDSSSAMLAEFSRKHPEARFVHGLAENASEYFSAAFFDAVISTNAAASFVSDVPKMLSEIHRVLKPGGAIYLSFLNRTSLRRAVGLLRGRYEGYRTRGDLKSRGSIRAQVYTKRELIELCRAAGFKEVRVNYRSVFGGVWESSLAVSAEHVVSQIVPFLGHIEIVTGIRASAHDL